MGFTVGLGQKPRRRTVEAGDLLGLEDEIKLAKKRFGLAETARVVSCYEAGRDGFWLHRYPLNSGQENMVIDAAFLTRLEQVCLWDGRRLPPMEHWQPLRS